MRKWHVLMKERIQHSKIKEHSWLVLMKERMQHSKIKDHSWLVLMKERMQHSKIKDHSWQHHQRSSTAHQHKNNKPNNIVKCHKCFWGVTSPEAIYPNASLTGPFYPNAVHSSPVHRTSRSWSWRHISKHFFFFRRSFFHSILEREGQKSIWDFLLSLNHIPKNNNQWENELKDFFKEVQAVSITQNSSSTFQLQNKTASKLKFSPKKRFKWAKFFSIKKRNFQLT